MSLMASQNTILTIVYSTVYSGANQRKHQNSASVAFVWGIHRGLVNSSHKGPVTRKMFPFDDVVMSKHVRFNDNLYLKTNVVVMMALSLPMASESATGDDGAISTTIFYFVLLCFVLFSVVNVIAMYVRTFQPPREGSVIGIVTVSQLS